MEPLVIKCGGSVLNQLPHTFYENIVQLQKSGKWQPVIVHGGGPYISELLKKLKIPVQFVDGLRVTTEEVLDIVEMVLSGSINKKVVRKLIQAGGKSQGLSGIDGQLIEAIPNEQADRLGFVGEVHSINKEMILNMCAEGYIPVISPVGIDAKGQRYNINADDAASAVAQELKAKLCFVSDIPGIYVEEDGQQRVLEQVTSRDVQELIKEEVITGGMIPKVKAALSALSQDVQEVVILSGVEENHLLDFCAGKPRGTKIVMAQTSLKEGGAYNV